MDWGRFGVRMIPRFAMGQPCHLPLSSLSQFFERRSVIQITLSLATRIASGMNLSTLQAQKRVFNSSENTGIEEKEIREQDVPYPKVIS